MELYPTHACQEFRENFALLEKYCGYSENAIPQQAVITRFLKGTRLILSTGCLLIYYCCYRAHWLHHATSYGAVDLTSVLELSGVPSILRHAVYTSSFVPVLFH
jgi:hypothetical protein